MNDPTSNAVRDGGVSASVADPVRLTMNGQLIVLDAAKHVVVKAVGARLCGVLLGKVVEHFVHARISALEELRSVRSCLIGLISPRRAHIDTPADGWVRIEI